MADQEEARPGIPTLTTKRLVLRPFVPEDLDELVVIHAEESFWWYPRRAAMTAEETGVFLSTVLGRYRDDGFGIEALIDRASGRMIGWAGLAVPHFLPEILPAVEVGWRLSGPCRGRGFATEAGAAAAASSVSPPAAWRPSSACTSRRTSRRGVSWSGSALRTASPRRDPAARRSRSWS